MATYKEKPSEARQNAFAAEAELRADMAQDYEQSMSEQNTLYENDSVRSPSTSTEVVAVDAQNAEKPPLDEKPQRSKGKIAVIMLSLCMAVFLAALDATIVTTALPTIAANYAASEADYTWIGSAYPLAAAAATPTWGKVSDIFGRKPVLLTANLVFFVGSLICGVSINVKMLIAGRVIQGIGGGGLLILVNICISDMFSMRSRGIYFGMVGMTWALASALGPVLGGVFTQLATWRWCFYVNLPCDGLAFTFLFFFLDIETSKTPLLAGLKSIDWLGSLTVVSGTVMLLFGLEFGGVTYPWSSATVICLIVFGIVTVGLFFLIEWKVARYPIMPLRLFARRSNIAALGTCFIHGFIFISGSYYLPLYFQAVLGATPLLSGVYLFPFVISLSLVSAAAGVFIRKTGQYLPPIWFGMSVMTLGFGLYINFPPGVSWPRIIIYQIIAGVGVGPNFQSPLIALQSLVPPRDIATATATFGFMRNLASSISIIVGGVIFQNGMQRNAGVLAGALPPAIAHQLGGGSAGANTAIVAKLPPAQHDVAVGVYTRSLQTMWIFYTVLAAIGFFVSLAIGKQTLSKTHEAAKTGLQEQENARLERKAEKLAKASPVGSPKLGV